MLAILGSHPPGCYRASQLCSLHNDRPTKSNVPAESYVAGDGEMVEHEDDGNGAGAPLEISNLLERVA